MLPASFMEPILNPDEILAHLQVGVLILDRQGRAVFANARFLQLAARPWEELSGRTTEALFASAAEFHSFWAEAWTSFESGRPYLGEQALQRPGAAPLWCRIHGRALERNHETEGSAWVFDDLTDRRRAEASANEQSAALEDANRELAAAVAQAQSLAERAETATAAKSEFLANVSHEIRTPLHAILGLTGLLSDSGLRPDQREHVKMVQTAGKALLQVVNDILDFSKLEAGKMVFDSIGFDLRTCVEEVGDMLGFKAQEKGIELTLLIYHDVPGWVEGDPARLRQILLNLVNNALKFTDEGEVMVTVTCPERDQSACVLQFEVADTGIGIPPERLATLFESFVQVDASPARRHGGTGLGLAIAREFVDAMGGRIGVQSVPNRGSTFTFTVRLGLPAEAPEQEGAPLADVRGARVLAVDNHASSRTVLREQLAVMGCAAEMCGNGPAALGRLREAAASGTPFQAAVINFNMPGMRGTELGEQIQRDPALRGVPMILLTSVPRRGDAAKARACGFAGYLTKPVKMAHLHAALARALADDAGTGGPPAPLLTQRHINDAVLRKPRVLVVDDNRVNLRVAVRMLERLGFGCDLAESGRKALDAFCARRYDLVVMDCHMPEMDGFEATREIRAREAAGARVPIIALTASALREDRQRAIDAGMDAYLSKPVTQEELERTILRHLPGSTLPAGSAAPPPVNLAQIREVTAGDAEFESQLFRAFLSDCEERLVRLEEGVKAGDLKAIAREAHAVKGASANLGAEGMRALARRIEACGAHGGANGGAESAAPMLEALRAEFQRVADFLRAESAEAAR